MMSIYIYIYIKFEVQKNQQSLMGKVGETESFYYHHHSAIIKEMKISNLSHYHHYCHSLCGWID